MSSARSGALVAFAVAVALAGCSSHEKRPRPTFSPNGEPLVGSGWPRDCHDALAVWFDRADANHDGKLSLVELQNDATHQYKVMDLRHNGKVTAEELSTYRQHVMGGQYASISTPDAPPEGEPRLDDEERRGRHRRNDSDEPKTDAFSSMPTDMPDPVMSADTDLDGSVTPEEFAKLVAQNFADFDADHAGFVTLDEVQKSCP